MVEFTTGSQIGKDNLSPLMFNLFVHDSKIVLEDGCSVSILKHYSMLTTFH